MDNFLKKYNLPKLAKEIENLNSLIFNKETEIINENLTKKTQAQTVSPGSASKDVRKTTAPHRGSASMERKEGAPLRDQHGEPEPGSKTSPELHTWLYFSPSQGAEILKKVNKSTPETCRKSEQASQVDFLGRRRFYTRESNNSHLNSKR